MNKNQRTVAVVVASIMLTMLLFPPFEAIRQYGKFSLGYSFILMPPEFLGDGTVNIGLLLMEWVMVIVGGVMGWVFFKDKTDGK